MSPNHLGLGLMLALLALSNHGFGGDLVRGGQVSLSDALLQPGSNLDLTGEWLYKPGYAVAVSGQPQTNPDSAGYVSIPVPQMLSRIQWWLDDSEGFKAFERSRLERLGFDTDRAEDGWYRLNLEVPKLPAGRRVFILFEGIAMKCQVHWNGRFLGDHEGMFSRFGFDLTPQIKEGQNQLDVYVSMEKVDTSTMSLGQAVTVNLTASKITTLSKGMFGPLSPNHENRDYDLHGIWQPVKLLVRGPGAIDDVWFNPGLDGGVLNVVARSLGNEQEALITASWTERTGGKSLATVGPEPARLGVDNQWFQLKLSGVRPKLWSPAQPHLYTLKVRLHTPEGATLDERTLNVGFRTFQVRGHRLFLNDQPYWLRGANQLPYGKNPWDPSLARKLIRLMHDGNQRITRTHATPWNEAWLEAADEIGLGVSIEGIRPWALCGRIGLPPEPMLDHWLRENEDMIRRCRNHPSVLLWTVGNEMLLRDARNLDKWKVLSRVVKQTRELDPSRPVIVSSEYERDSEFFEAVLRPAGVDDGDIDDIHRYFGWYAESPFANNSLVRSRERSRPLIGQEMSTGYPDLDTGLPVARYLNYLLTPQAWVGQAAGEDPTLFLEHHRAVTKRLAEQLRYRRRDETAGFLLFSSECWFANSYDPLRVKPYPVYQAVAEAWAPVGLAIETNRRRFFSGEKLPTAVFITNDDELFEDHRQLSLWVAVTDPDGKRKHSESKVVEIPHLKYYQTVRIPVQLALPAIRNDRQKVQVIWLLKKGTRELSRTSDFVEIFKRSTSPRSLPVVGSHLALGPSLQRFVQEERVFDTFGPELHPANKRSQVILMGADADLQALGAGGEILERIKKGATAILFSPGDTLRQYFPRELAEIHTVVGEFADLSPSLGSPLCNGLEPTDLKWWGRFNDDRVFVVDRAYRLRPDANCRTLVGFIPAHGYLPEDKLDDIQMAALFEIPIGLGRLWVCGLDLERSVAVDPAARRFALNLISTAGDSKFAASHLSER